MAITIQKTFGGRPKLVTALGVTGERYPPPEGCMLHSMMALCLTGHVADRPLGNLVGAIG
jgi:hypothetical protein